jgi:Domain of unknown function (DUF4252)
MKKVQKILVLLACVAFVGIADCTARCRHFEKTLERIRERKETASLTLPSWVLRAVMHSEDKELQQFLRDVDNLSMTSYEGRQQEIVALRDEISTSLTADDFEALVQVADGGDKVDIRMRTENGRVKEAVLFVSDASSLVVLHFEGNVDLKRAVAFSRKVHAGEM